MSFLGPHHWTKIQGCYSFPNCHKRHIINIEAAKAVIALAGASRLFDAQKPMGGSTNMVQNFLLRMHLGGKRRTGCLTISRWNLLCNEVYRWCSVIRETRRISSSSPPQYTTISCDIYSLYSSNTYWRCHEPF